jgi:hypothetical protein
MLSYLLGILWIGFGLWTRNVTWMVVGSGATFFIVAYLLRRYQKDSIQKIFWWWLGFQSLLVASSLIHRTTESIHLALLTSIGIMWLFVGVVFRKNKVVISQVLQSLIIAGIGLSGLWIVSGIFGWDILTFGPDSLVVQASFFKNHNHIGDFIVLPLLLLSLRRHRIALLFGVVLLASLSRSALIGFLVSLLYVGFNRDVLLIHKKKLLYGLAALTVLYIGFSLYKPPLAARGYMVQAVAGFSTYPFGVGLGNFQIVSADESHHWFGMSDFSYYTHNLVFEWISGIGVGALLGIGLLVLSAYFLGHQTRTREKELLRASWWAMTAVLMFDSAYVIPSYYWLWMLLMGLAR